MKVAARDRTGVVHVKERYRVAPDEYDDITACGRTITTIEFPNPLERGFTLLEYDSPITCIACLGRAACSSG